MGPPKFCGCLWPAAAVQTCSVPVCKGCSVFVSVLQSPEEIDKEERPEVDTKKKSDEPGDDTDVFTEKHSENLFQRTEVLAGKM